MKISQKQIDAVIALEGAKRYKHFIKSYCRYARSLGLIQGWMGIGWNRG